MTFVEPGVLPVSDRQELPCEPAGCGLLDDEDFLSNDPAFRNRRVLDDD